MRMPKLAKDLASLVGIARKETDSATIEAALIEARSQIEAATREREAAEAAYRDGLLDSSQVELEKRLAEKAAATVRLDRAEALVAALTQRLTMAREEQDRARRKAIHDDTTKCNAIRARLPAEYRTHALAIRNLLRTSPRLRWPAHVPNGRRRSSGSFSRRRMKFVVGMLCQRRSSRRRRCACG